MTIKQTFTGDPSQLLKALADLSRAYVQLENRIERTNTTSRRGAEEATRANQRAASFVSSPYAGGNPWAAAHIANQRGMPGANPWTSASRPPPWAQTAGSIAANNSQQATSNQLWEAGAAMVARWTSAIAIAHVGLKAYNDELERTAQLQRDAAKTISGVAGAQGTLAFNTLSRQDFAFGVGQVNQIMKATGFPSRELLTGAMGTAISAADTKEQGAEAVRIAASLARHNPELLDTLAAAGLDIATSAGVSPAEGIALSLSAGKTARVAAPVAQARNISQAVASMTAARSPTGNRRSAALEAAQLMSAINKAAKDPRGERSRTAAQQLADHLDEFFEIGDERTVAGRKFRVKPAFDPGTVGGRFELLGRDAKLQQQFFDKYNFEAGFENIIRQMMVPGTEQRRVLEETREPGGPFRVDYDTSIVRTMEGLVTGGTPQLTQSTLNAAAQGAKDRHLSDFTRGGVTANIAKDREQGLAASSRYRYFTPFSLGMLSSGFDVPLIGNVPGPARMLARLTNREAEHELAQLKFARQEMALINAPSQMRGEERAAFQLLEELIAINERQLAELKKVSQPKPVGAAAQGERGGQRER